MKKPSVVYYRSCQNVIVAIFQKDLDLAEYTCRIHGEKKVFIFRRILKKFWQNRLVCTENDLKADKVEN